MNSTKREHLIAAIVAAPDDDGPRSVYADWLQERGDPRGEFIAVQLLRSTGRATKVVRAREKELLAAHGALWSALFTSAGHAVLKFERGFAAGIRMTSAGWPDELEAALVTELELGDPAQALPRVRDLRVLRNVRPDQLPAWLADGCGGRLERLSASLPAGNGERPFLEVQLPALQWLELEPWGQRSCSTEQLLHLVRSQLARTVRALSLNCPGVLSREVLEAIPETVREFNVGLGAADNRFTFFREGRAWERATLRLESTRLQHHQPLVITQLSALAGLDLEELSLSVPGLQRRHAFAGTAKLLARTVTVR